MYIIKNKTKIKSCKFNFKKLINLIFTFYLFKFFSVKELLEKAKNDFKYKWENVKTVRYFLLILILKMFIKKF